MNNGQISIFEYIEDQKDIFNFDKAFELFHEVCRHRGWHKPATETEPSIWMCGKDAKCWADWKPCCVENCEMRGGKI